MSFMPSARWRDVTGASRRRRRFDGIASNHASPAPLTRPLSPGRHRAVDAGPPQVLHARRVGQDRRPRLDREVGSEDAPPGAAERARRHRLARPLSEAIDECDPARPQGSEHHGRAGPHRGRLLLFIIIKGPVDFRCDPDARRSCARNAERHEGGPEKHEAGCG